MTVLARLPLITFADAISLVAAAAPDLAATDILVETVPVEPQWGDPYRARAAWYTRLQIIAVGEKITLDLVDLLKLAPHEGNGHRAWLGIYPLTDAAERPLQVELTLLADEPPTAPVPLPVALSTLDLVVAAAAVVTDIPTMRVRVVAHETRGRVCEIHAADTESALILWTALDDVDLPMPVVVLAP
jgi:hypothetical protein